MPSNEYDALLTAAPPPSEYDALIQAAPAPTGPAAAQLPAQAPGTPPAPLRPSGYVGRGEFDADAGASSVPLAAPGQDDQPDRARAFLQGAGVPTSIPEAQGALQFLVRSPVQDVKDIYSGLTEIPEKVRNWRETLATSPASTVYHDPLSPEAFGVYGTAAGMLTPALLEKLRSEPTAVGLKESAVSQPESRGEAVYTPEPNVPKHPEPRESAGSQSPPPQTQVSSAHTEALPRSVSPEASQGTSFSQPQDVPVSSLPQGPTEPGVSLPKPPNEEVLPNGETLTPREPATPVEQATPSAEVTTGVANRVLENEADRIGEVEPGEGMSWQEMVDLGQQELNKGADPQMIARRLQRTGRISPTDFAVLRAERERLAQQTVAAEQAVRDNPNDIGAQQAYNAARAQETAWVKDVVQPAKTQTSDIFRGMQGESPIDASTFAGLRRAVVDQTGRDIKPGEVPVLEKRAQAVQKAQLAESNARQRLGQAIDRAAPTKGVKSADQLRTEFSEHFRRKLPC